jgi:hypothetical protein
MMSDPLMFFASIAAFTLVFAAIGAIENKASKEARVKIEDAQRMYHEQRSRGKWIIPKWEE